MKQLTLLFLSMICISSYVYPQVNGSFFTLQLGSQTCLFKYEEKLDTAWVEVDRAHRKDMGVEKVTQVNPVTLEERHLYMKKGNRVITKKSLILQDNTLKTAPIRVKEILDTTAIIDSQTQKRIFVSIEHDEPEYHIETEMSYFDFLLLLKSKFEIKNPQKKLHVSSFNIYYETKDTGGLISVKYPETTEGVVSKLNCLANGGFILLSLKSDDHNQVYINNQGGFLALIHIKK